MKQYCRYCIYLCVNNVPYCNAKEQVKSRESCCRPNRCKDFILCEAEPEYQDAFGETNGYHPRKAKPKDDGEYQQYEMNHGYFMMLDGWTNCHDQMPDQPGIYLVENHNGDRGKQEAVMSFGHMAWKTAKWNAYDTNWWKPLETTRKESA